MAINILPAHRASDTFDLFVCVVKHTNAYNNANWLLILYGSEYVARCCVLLMADSNEQPIFSAGAAVGVNVLRSMVRYGVYERTCEHTAHTYCCVLVYANVGGVCIKTI